MGGEDAGKSLDIRAVLVRMAHAAGVKTVAELSEVTGLSQQALTQSKYRGSIALPLIMRVAEKTGCSTDFLLYGKGEPKEKEDGFVTIESLDSNDPVVKFSVKWFDKFKVEGSEYRVLAQDNDIYLININDKEITNGIYILGAPVAPVARHCKRQLLNSEIIVEDEEEPLTRSDLQKIGVLGRVVWRGTKA